MRSCWLMGALLLVLPGLFAKPDPAQLAAMADAIKYLQQLDKYYAQVARPSTRSGTSARQAGSPADLTRVRHALKMLKLQELDRFYSQRARPRFGKRTEQVEQDGYEQQYVLLFQQYASLKQKDGISPADIPIES